MSSSFIQSDLLLADAVIERELDLGIRAIAPSIVRSPYGSIKMNLCATRIVSGLNDIADAAVRSPYGSLKMNLGAAREVLVIAGSKAST